MTQRLQTKLLYFVLALYIAMSLGFWVSGVLAERDGFLHGSEHVAEPFRMDEDPLTVTSVKPEAQRAGLRKGDTIVGLADKLYTGENQRLRILRDARPGSTLVVDYTRGAQRSTASIRLVARDASLSRTRRLEGLVVVMSVTSFIALVVGYWIVAARPRDRNAWLILLLLSFAEVLYFGPNYWPGMWLSILVSWYDFLQIMGLLALFLLGVYFPERWRWDVKFPLLRWTLTIFFCAVLCLSWFTDYLGYFQALSWKRWMTTAGHGFDPVLEAAELLCVLLYWVALFDKMRSASTADARRRLQVLLAGSLLGLGGVLVFIVWFPHLDHYTEKHNWPRYTGAILFLFYPLTLAYVVLVQRAMDVRILLRMGTKYALARASVLALQLAAGLFIFARFVLPAYEQHRHGAWDIGLLVAGLLLVARMYALRNNPANRLQRWIDRKFFREAYDAELVLSELSEQVRDFTQPEPLIETISRRLGEVLHVSRVAVLLEAAGNSYELQGAGLPGTGGALATPPLTLGPHSYTVRNLKRSSQPVTLYRENPDGWFLLADEEERELLDELRTEVLLPLPGRERLMGVMTLSAKQSEEPYTSSDLRLLQSVATQAGLALEISALGRSLAQEAARRERVDREIEIAREVQDRLLPQCMPTVEGATIAGACRPAQGVGGDYYDLIEFADGRLGLAVGDVSGKGISAALLMASLRASLRGMALGGPDDLTRMMEDVNHLVYEASASNRYATFFFGAYDPRTRLLRFVNAGHNPPLVQRGEMVMRLEAGGPVIGLLSMVSYEEQSVQLEPGDLLLAYTDGISEAMTLAEEEWGEERMLSAACGDPGSDAAAILRCVFEAADGFAGSAPQYDDMTLLVLKLNGTPNGHRAPGKDATVTSSPA